MLKKITPFILIAFTALFTACSTTSSPLIEKAQNSIVAEDYDAAITAANQFIELQPNNPIGYYYLGTALGQKGQSQDPPSEGTTYFEQMNEAYQQAQTLAEGAEEVPDEINRIESVQSSFWRLAHNTSVKLINVDSVRNAYDNPDQRALAYITNAIVIQPTHAISYRVKAILSGRTQKFAEAAEAQKKFIGMADSVSVTNYRVLVQYYRQAEQIDKAESALLEAQKQFPEDLQLIALLADVYTQQGETQKALDLVKTLVEKEPNNPQYRLSYGSRILIASSKIQDKYEDNVEQIFKQERDESTDNSQKVQALRQKNEQFRSQIIELQENAIEQFKKVLEYRPDDATAYHNLGVIYQNRAALYYDLRNLADSDADAAKYDEQADGFFEEARKYYERAVEIDPDNKSYWRSLYTVYINLGLDEKAKEAAQKAGIN